MKRIISTALVLCVTILATVSCSKKSDTPSNVVSKNNIPLSGSQEVPANASTATGSADVIYDKGSKIMTYTLRWSGLTTAASAMHFHGPVARGTNAGVLQGITGFTSGVAGSMSGTVIIDGVTLKEEDLLAGKWYFNIHNSSFAGGEIRGQIEF